MPKKTDFFQQRVADFSKLYERLQSQFKSFSFYRIALFVGYVVLFVWSLNYEMSSVLAISTIVFMVSFAWLVKKHSQITKERKLAQKLVELNTEEINRLNFHFDGIFDGAEFADDAHPYTSDLDIFGRNSIFQLINRAGTHRGISLLKSWLKQPATRENIEIRQDAARELKPLIDWRQKIQAHGKRKSGKKEKGNGFYNWLNGEDKIRNNRFYSVVPYLVMTFSTILIFGYILEVFSLYALLLPFIITGYFLYQIIDYSRSTYGMTESGVEVLGSIENIVLQIENQSFQNDHLLKLQSLLQPQGIVASAKIKQLRIIFDWLSLRSNQMYHIFNSIFLLDFLLLAKAEKWRSTYKDEISAWFDAIAEFEALNSIAAFAFANEAYVFPEVGKKHFEFQCTNLGHPLIPVEKRVCNDFHFSGRGNTCIVTGSNMAGKSTFLRTLGINAILAFTGAPVCADSFLISKFQVFTSMRTKDNLEENISSFYAELIRLKMLLEQVELSTPVFYLLDEILKGTNSVDRHIGAESLILQLNEKIAFGIVSTHDLELGKLEKINNHITNYNFSSSISGEEIIFDYKLRKGICQSTNASQLMAKIGIQIKS